MFLFSCAVLTFIVPLPVEAGAEWGGAAHHQQGFAKPVAVSREVAGVSTRALWLWWWLRATSCGALLRWPAPCPGSGWGLSAGTLPATEALGQCWHTACHQGCWQVQGGAAARASACCHSSGQGAACDHTGQLLHRATAWAA